jgi:hypothetical protein
LTGHALLCLAVVCPAVLVHCSGTVVRTGPGKYDKGAEGQRKPMTVQPGDKVGGGRRVGQHHDVAGPAPSV